MTEKEMMEYEVPYYDNWEDVTIFITGLEKMHHDYGTRANALSLGAEAVFKYLCNKLGVSDFQSSWAALNFVKRIIPYKHGFKIIDYNKILYPQYFYNKEDFLSAEEILNENLQYFKNCARNLLKENESSSWKASPDVIEHWNYILNLKEKK